MTDRTERIRTLRGRALRQDVARALGQILERTLTDDDFVDIDETLRLRDLYFNRLRTRANCFHRVIPADAFKFTNLFPGPLGTTNVELILFHEHDRLTGGIRLSSGEVFGHAGLLFDSLKEDLTVMTADGAFGLCVEFNQSTDQFGYDVAGFFEVTGWGTLRLEK